MPIDINAIFNETRGRNFELFEEHVNPVFVKVLRTLGFNRSWVRGEGAYLWDETGTRYLDFLTNWGVFNFGRRHPVIRGALQQVLDSDFPGWVGFDAPPLAAALAQRARKAHAAGFGYCLLQQLRDRSHRSGDQILACLHRAALHCASCESIPRPDHGSALVEWRGKFSQRFRADAPG